MGKAGLTAQFAGRRGLRVTFPLKDQLALHHVLSLLPALPRDQGARG